MKKIRKIVALALATVMMMAMSITAFATEASTEATKGVTFTVTNLANDESTTLKLYELATTKNGGWNYATWIPENAIAEKDTEGNPLTKADFKWDSIKAAAEEQTPLQTYSTTETNGVYETSHTFNGLEGALYLVLASGTDYVYNPMAEVTYEYVNGAYTLKNATVVAKCTNIPVKKEITEDANKFVKIGDTVEFKITTAVPNDNESFTVIDEPTNLENLTITKVTVADSEYKVNGEVPTFTSNTEKTKYSLDLSKLLEDKSNVGKTVVITVTGVVGKNVVLDSKDDDGNTISGYAFENTAYSNKSKTDSKSTVTGYTGDATLTKYDANQTNILSGAKFNVVTKKADGTVESTLKFERVETGVYKLSEANDAVDEIEATNGTVQIIGLDEGTYYFHETVAPTGYSLNPSDTQVVIVANTEKNVSVAGVMTDTTLIQLPFTGGMGTTIFTVLGVAIMAMAAALYFATKRKATK
ncbi:MAG: LPXTG cell wall anchor domain-containing protein [Pseudobutyrivibrio ruminis]|uniref:SpaH/EbpB family LPXTG-anchored major pilin n=1 Tax=Pseudobutyrivibrio ruminis TaxID=46206 RepID=UPI0026F0B1EC|nr:SpaH/EbpB family LPXTG-anchored major pilin [Pseudobutyrivibrio ruminis]MBE5914067.1 LPXTG cell wall anchor domain-containing protein [Pseudobutyrivibrio ruminis]